MLTARGWWLLVVILIVLSTVVLLGERSMTIAGLALLLWFAWEWLGFAIRAHLVLPRLRVRREVRDERGAVDTLWAGRSFRMRLRLRVPGGVGLAYVRVGERIPFGVERTAGDADAEGPVTTDHPLELNYSIRCASPGRARFEGLR